MDEKYIPQGVVRLVLPPPLLLIINNGKWARRKNFKKGSIIFNPLKYFGVDNGPIYFDLKAYDSETW